MTLLLTGNDWHGSPLRTLSRGSNTLLSWSPYGATAPRSGSALPLPGFNGERQDPYSGVSHLGNGYRAYSPALRRFTCPDSESPFGVGGINAYAYCNADPVNQTDPSGHGPVTWLLRMAIRAGVRIGLSEALADGMATTLATAGKIETGLELASSAATGIASTSLAGSNPQRAAKLGWASMGLGLAGGLDDAIALGARVRREISGLSDKLSRTASFSAGQSVRLGGNMKKIDMLFNGVYTFEDTYKGGRRLNIVSHGAFLDGTSYLYTKGRGGEQFIHAEEIAGVLSSRYSLDDYNSLRVLACHSAEGGENAFGAVLHRLTGKEVKAFKGTLDGNFEPGALTDLLAEAERNDMYQNYVTTFAQKYGFRAYKKNPYTLFTTDKEEIRKWWSWQYKPVHFPPR
ncbi:RHS repeat-associated core domain-containing protein [Salmonella enterica subsp. enterica]|nr:RHS repeat-associated core domain-containing protein [Salmonella enterica subsp. enterica serovar Mikawasima]EDN7229197.1 RHS repeat-associated core domain-containing protein [Salmonella enterica subsp. enterica serovar Mikawasima]